MKNFQFIALSLLLLVTRTYAGATLESSSNHPTQKVQILSDYTRNNAFEFGDVYWVWKVAIIPKNTSQDKLVNIAKELYKTYPNKRIRIFDDKAKVNQFIQRDIWFNDKSGKLKEVPFPEQWVIQHHIANINDRSDIANNRWQLVTRHGNYIAYLD